MVLPKTSFIEVLNDNASGCTDLYRSALLATIEASLLTDVLLKIATTGTGSPPRNRTLLRRTLFGTLLLESISIIAKIIVL
ncbi:hypothetical protein IWX80_002682 [Flavobacterium sp. CAN_S2]